MHFIWDTAYETGNEQIDGQHRMIFDAANMLIEAIHKAKENAVLEHAFQLLREYTATHFSDEERHYAEIGSTLLDAQIRQHQTLLEQLEAIWQDKLSGSAHAGQALSVWMERHLLPHITDCDTQAQKAVV